MALKLYILLFPFTPLFYFILFQSLSGSLLIWDDNKLKHR